MESISPSDPLAIRSVGKIAGGDLFSFLWPLITYIQRLISLTTRMMTFKISLIIFIDSQLRKPRWPFFQEFEFPQAAVHWLPVRTGQGRLQLRWRRAPRRSRPWPRGSQRPRWRCGRSTGGGRWDWQLPDRSEWSDLSAGKPPMRIMNHVFVVCLLQFLTPKKTTQNMGHNQQIFEFQS